MPEVGLEPRSSPCGHWELPKTCRVPPSPTDVRPDPTAIMCTLCTRSFNTLRPCPGTANIVFTPCSDCQSGNLVRSSPRSASSRPATRPASSRRPHGALDAGQPGPHRACAPYGHQQHPRPVRGPLLPHQRSGLRPHCSLDATFEVLAWGQDEDVCFQEE